MCRTPDESRGSGTRLGLCDPDCGRNGDVWIEGNRVDAFAHQPRGEIGVVGRRLATDADRLVEAAARVDGTCDQPANGLVSFIEEMRNGSGVAVETKRQLRQIVRAD